MLRALSRPAVKMMDRYLPDPFVFVIVLTLVAAGAAMVFEGNSPQAVMRQWGNGFLEKLAGLAKTPAAAIVLVTVVSLIASWINWGFGLVVGALFAKALARQIRVDYRLLIAAAYSGFIVWHGGLAGSVPLVIATEGHFTQDLIGVVGTGQTIFSGFNLIIVAVLFVVVPLVNRAMLPSEADSIYADPAALEDVKDTPSTGPMRPAEYLENSRILMWLVGIPGLLYLGDYFLFQGGTLNLNIVNFVFLSVAIVLHGTARHLLDALQEGIKGGAGIVIQFPFYAGIMAIMTQSGLAQSMSEWFVSISTATTLPFWTFISAGIVNIFVPSGGGQWAVQAPVMLPAAQALGADVARVAMSVAWGDAWTNLLQPFWALPMLGIAGLKAKDIMGFCLIHLVITGVIISVLLTFL
jgi:short-chain fatty acids transporter